MCLAQALTIDRSYCGNFAATRLARHCRTYSPYGFMFIFNTWALVNWQHSSTKLAVPIIGSIQLHVHVPTWLTVISAMSS
eukprot:CAMPEP_0115073316 /NCGR_PEP_ID=MMETSP0227-20121206/14718_1 /TAXON_ID=89957 /ORGANISM="Polarella glacialis, Strain CCMP 1383" /LENGTH=79 /DNA_ID=CAMNT_0002460161 /DNA_START=501 /DNA_END=736 /DNA_ORIENTATION=-